jgi:hypothetical protein
MNRKVQKDLELSLSGQPTKRLAEILREYWGLWEAYGGQWHFSHGAKRSTKDLSLQELDQAIVQPSQLDPQHGLLAQVTFDKPLFQTGVIKDAVSASSDEPGHEFPRS